tara:strand:+ start:282 stop:1016 length:735 start_codon:yes stop_codon:yes gene_type:complete
MKNKTLIFCPVFNEIHHLPNLLERIKLANYDGDFYFIDSGSSDGSSELIENSGFKYIKLKKNLGVGYSIITAVEFAIENEYEIICGISGNNKMDPNEINNLTEPIINENIDFVQGSRFLDYKKNDNTPKFRALSIPVLSKLVSFLFKINVTDVTCGFRAYKLDLIKRARFEINQKWLYGYSFEPYLYSNVFLDKNVTKKEIPVKMSYPLEKNIKYTKIKPILNYPGLVMPYIIGKYLFKGFDQK